MKTVKDLVTSVEEILDLFKERLEPIEQKGQDLGIELRLLEELEKIHKRLKSDSLVTLGVVGQIKTGKSTLLNALFFDGEEILPTAVTPETARLTIIGYSPEGKKFAKIHFYSTEDWEEIKENSPKIYQDAIKKLGNEIEIYIDREPLTIPLENLREYVAAEGRYSDVVKYTEVFLPDRRIEGIKIVDTPGLNDPVESRSRVTREYIRECDAVLFLSHPKRFLDKNDLLLAADQLAGNYMDTVILVAPRVDELDPEEFRILKEGLLSDEWLHDRIEKALKGEGETVRNKVKEWFSAENAVMISAMAFIIGRKLQKGVPLTEDEEFYFNNMQEYGWPMEPERLINRSHIGVLERKIEEKVLSRKQEIILNKPLNKLLALSERAVKEAKAELERIEREINAVQKGIEEYQRELENRKKELQRLSEVYSEKIEALKKELLDLGTGLIVKTDAERRGDKVKTFLKIKLGLGDDALEIESSCYIDIATPWNKESYEREIAMALGGLANEVFEYAAKKFNDKIKMLLTKFRTELQKEGFQRVGDMLTIIDRYSKEAQEELSELANKWLDFNPDIDYSRLKKLFHFIGSIHEENKRRVFVSIKSYIIGEFREKVKQTLKNAVSNLTSEGEKVVIKVKEEFRDKALRPAIEKMKDLVAKIQDRKVTQEVLEKELMMKKKFLEEAENEGRKLKKEIESLSQKWE